MSNKIIEIDTEDAKRFGFTSDKFSKDSYLWEKGDMIYISLIFSRHEGKGNLSKLFKTIKEKGYRIIVPTPFPKMERILKRKGARHFIDNQGEMGSISCYEL